MLVEFSRSQIDGGVFKTGIFPGDDLDEPKPGTNRDRHILTLVKSMIRTFIVAVAIIILFCAPPSRAQFQLETVAILESLAMFGVNVEGTLVGSSQFRLAVAHGNSLYSNKEQFEFSIGTERIVLNSSNPRVYFNKRFAAGDTFRVTQTAGPRPCEIPDHTGLVFADQDIVLPVNCGNPPLSLFEIEVAGIESGEIFKFSDNFRRSISMSFSTTANLGGFPFEPLGHFPVQLCPGDIEPSPSVDTESAAIVAPGQAMVDRLGTPP